MLKYYRSIIIYPTSMEIPLTNFNPPFAIGSKKFSNRLIQGPLAGFSAAPMRMLFEAFVPPAYCVTEMISANDVLR